YRRRSVQARAARRGAYLSDLARARRAHRAREPPVRTAAPDRRKRIEGIRVPAPRPTRGTRGSRSRARHLGARRALAAGRPARARAFRRTKEAARTLPRTDARPEGHPAR